MSDPLPTTARGGQQGFGGDLLPHSESHELDGNDPILGQILFHGSATLNSLEDQTSSTFTDVPTLSVTINHRGGSLLIIVTGSILTFGVNNALGEIRAVVGSSNLTGYTIGVAAVTATDEQLDHAGSPMWYDRDRLPGNYIVKIQTREVNGGVGDTIRLAANLSLIVFELLPVSRT